MHFNLWDSKRNNLHFLDIGILCKNDTFNIKIGLPKCGNSLDIEDLSSKFIDNIPNAIFNSSIDIEETNRIRVFKIENNVKFVLSPIDTDKCVNKEIQNEICISVEKQMLPQNNVPIAEYRYYRFRIKNFALNKVIIEVDSKSKSFESSFSSCKVIDFRINDLKLLPVVDAQKFASSSDKFEKIHFLYITDINEDVQLSGSDCTSRFLERDLWNNYLDLSEQKFDMIAYHLRKEKSLDANFLIKCNYNKTSIWHLVVYAIVVIILAVIANHLPSFFKFVWNISRAVFVKG